MRDGANFAGDAATSFWHKQARHPNFHRGHIYAATTDEPQTDLEFSGGKPAKLVQIGATKIVLNRGHRVSGRVVVGETGKAAANLSGQIVLQSSNVPKYLKTDANGEFTSPVFNDDVFHIDFIPAKNSNFARSITKINLKPGEFEKTVKISMRPGSLVSGTLKSATGEPVAGAHMLFMPDEQVMLPNSVESYVGMTKSDGSFEIFAKPETEGTLYATTTHDAGSEFRLSDYTNVFLSYYRPERSKNFTPSQRLSTAIASEVLPPVNFTVKRRSKVRLKGIVIDGNSKPVAKAEISLIAAAGSKGKLLLANKELYSSVSDQDGNFEIAELPEDSGASFKFVDGVTKQFKYVHLVEQKNGNDNLTVQLENGSKVRGRVLLDNQPLDYQSVRIHLAGPPVPLDGMKGAFTAAYFIEFGAALTNQNGEFEFSGVPSQQKLSVRLERDEYDFLYESVQSATDNGEVSVPEFEFDTLSAQISGIVLNTEGTPIANAQLSVQDTASGRYYMKHNNLRRGGNRSGKDGKFTIKYLPQDRKLKLMAYMTPPENDRTIKNPAELVITSGDSDIKVILD